MILGHVHIAAVEVAVTRAPFERAQARRQRRAKNVRHADEFAEISRLHAQKRLQRGEWSVDQLVNVQCRTRVSTDVVVGFPMDGREQTSCTGTFGPVPDQGPPACVGEQCDPSRTLGGIEDSDHATIDVRDRSRDRHAAAREMHEQAQLVCDCGASPFCAIHAGHVARVSSKQKIGVVKATSEKLAGDGPGQPVGHRQLSPQCFAVAHGVRDRKPAIGARSASSLPPVGLMRLPRAKGRQPAVKRCVVDACRPPGIHVRREHTQGRKQGKRVE